MALTPEPPPLAGIAEPEIGTMHGPRETRFRCGRIEDIEGQTILRHILSSICRLEFRPGHALEWQARRTHR